MSHSYFTLAEQAAEQYRGQCAPNPAVGAVIVADGEVIAIGAHTGCGKPHAEVEALRIAGDKARSATMYVTLEPCCHHGKTPPCTEAIIKAGIAKVYYAFTDPNPQVAGKGATQLREAGIVCEQVDVPSINAMYRAYAHWVKTGKPYVRAKLACSFDGKIAHGNGVPAAISGELAAQQTAKDRAHADAILTSVRTVLADNPRLSSRQEGSVLARPVWVLDSRLECPLDATLWESASELVLCHADGAPNQALQKRSAVLQAVATDEQGRLCWDDLFSIMGSKGLHEVWVEAGSTVVESLYQAGALSELIVSMSPCVLGPNATPGFTQPVDFTEKAHSVDWEILGETVRCVLSFVRL